MIYKGRYPQQYRTLGSENRESIRRDQVFIPQQRSTCLAAEARSRRGNALYIYIV